VLLVRQELQELDRQVLLAYLELTERQAQQAFKVMLVLLEQQVLRADKAQQELLGLLVPMGLQEAQVQQD
jgi:hypothetical protein